MEIKVPVLKIIILLFVFFKSLLAAGNPQLTYTINSSQSQFLVTTSKAGLLKFFGHDHSIDIRSFSGSVNLTSGSIVPASLEMLIYPDSLKVIDNVDEKERQQIERTMYNKVLETEKYPEVVFKSSKISVNKTKTGKYNTKIKGNLTLHGVTRPITINALITLKETTLRAKGSFSLKQKDFGIKRASALEGTVKVGDKILFSFDIFAER